MNIRPINTKSKKERLTFIRFPFDLYKDSDYWVPPFISEMDFTLNKEKNPLYNHVDADFLIAEEDRNILGRIAIFENKVYNEINDSKVAFFYYFDSVNNPNVSNALFQSTSKWAKERGLDMITGPRGLYGGDGIGALVEGFEYMPAIGIAYNYPYYDDLFHQAGLSKHDDLLSGFLSTNEYELPERIHDLADRVKKRRGFSIKNYNSKAQIKEDALNIRDVINVSFEGTPGYTPVQDDEIETIVDHLLMIAEPELIKLVFKGEEIVGFLFAYPNISRGLQKAKGRLFPFGWIHILRAKQKTDLLDINGIGILPEHQGVGVNTILYSEMDKSVRGYNFKHADVVQIREHNMKSMADMKALGIRWYKRHRVYEMGL